MTTQSFDEWAESRGLVRDGTTWAAWLWAQEAWNAALASRSVEIPLDVQHYIAQLEAEHDCPNDHGRPCSAHPAADPVVPQMEKSK